MKTINDLIQWLEANGKQEGANDIRKMLLDKAYAERCNFTDEACPSLNKLSHSFITWRKSDLGINYWYEVYERLCIMKENN